MNVIMAWAWMLWSSDAVENERYYGFGMDALVTVCSWNRSRSVIWAWMLRSTDALEHEHYYGLGMDALGT